MEGWREVDKKDEHYTAAILRYIGPLDMAER